MRSPTIVAVLACLACLVACGDPPKPPAPRPDDGPAPSEPAVVSRPEAGFSGLEGGALPEGWTPGEGNWQVESRAAGGPRVLQAARNGNDVFNVALLPDGFGAKDVHVEVEVEPVTGDLDRGGGPVWRAQDVANYYVARWNPLEDNFRVYAVVDGVRTELASADVEPGASPRSITIEMRGSTIHASLDGKRLLEVVDTTFAGAGRVGLWTKADARTRFSAFRAWALGAP